MTEMILTNAEQEILIHAVRVAVRGWSATLQEIQDAGTAPKGVEDAYMKRIAETDALVYRMYSGKRVVFKEASLTA
jgi:hypothetical protein